MTKIGVAIIHVFEFSGNNLRQSTSTIKSSSIIKEGELTKDNSQITKLHVAWTSIENYRHLKYRISVAHMYGVFKSAYSMSHMDADL